MAPNILHHLLGVVWIKWWQPESDRRRKLREAVSSEHLQRSSGKQSHPNTYKEIKQANRKVLHFCWKHWFGRCQPGEMGCQYRTNTNTKHQIWSCLEFVVLIPGHDSQLRIYWVFFSEESMFNFSPRAKPHPQVEIHRPVGCEVGLSLGAGCWWLRPEPISCEDPACQVPVQQVSSETNCISNKCGISLKVWRKAQNRPIRSFYKSRWTEFSSIKHFIFKRILWNVCPRRAFVAAFLNTAQTRQLMDPKLDKLSSLSLCSCIASQKSQRRQCEPVLQRRFVLKRDTTHGCWEQAVVGVPLGCTCARRGQY